jgi:hypothetical protein
MMTTPTKELCERLSHVEGMRRIGPLVAEARTTIEAQAKRIEELEHEAGYAKPVDPGDQSYPNALGVSQTLRRCREDLLTEARFVLWQAKRIASLEAQLAEATEKCLEFSTKYADMVDTYTSFRQAILDPENQPSQYGTTLVEHVEAQLRERGEPVARVEETPVGPKLYVNDVFVHSWFGCCYDDRVKAIAASINGAHPPAAAASEDKRDAERYRGWRDAVLASPLTFSSLIARALPADSTSGGSRVPSSDEWDAAIDAGIAAQKERQR